LAKHYDVAPQSLQSLGPVTSTELDTTPAASRLKIKWLSAPPTESATKLQGDKKAEGDWKSVRVLCNKELHSSLSDRSARHIELDVKVRTALHCTPHTTVASFSVSDP
jgi:hypothetical protein